MYGDTESSWSSWSTGGDGKSKTIKLSLVARFKKEKRSARAQLGRNFEVSLKSGKELTEG